MREAFPPTWRAGHYERQPLSGKVLKPYAASGLPPGVYKTAHGLCVLFCIWDFL